MSFEELIIRLMPKLKAVSKNVSRSISSVDESDILQEMLIFLLKKYREEKIEGYTDSYLLQGAWFHAKNYTRSIRSKDSVSETIGEDNSSILDTIRSEDEPGEDEIQAGMTVSGIMNLCRSSRERLVIRMLLEGFTLRETGKEIGVSGVMVCKMLNSIKKRALESPVV